MNHSTLRIAPEPLTDAGPVFKLSGNIDAHAQDVLNCLYDVGEGVIRLDFAEVQKVNSMGLALLLKLFEHCERRSVGVRITHANRMVGMLFKMTGLDHFLAANATPAVAAASSIGVKRTVAAPMPLAVAAAPAVQPSADAANHPAMAGSREKLRFLANLKNGGQLNGWYFFNTYLQRQLQVNIHLDLVHSAFDGGHPSAPSDLVFAKPFEAVRLTLEDGYRLIARPTEQADEVVVLARGDDVRSSLTDFAGCRVVTDTAASFVYLLGRFLLDESGLASDTVRYVFSGHETKAVRALLNGEADLLFMQSEAYRSLSAVIRGRLRLVDQTDSGLAFHFFCVKPAVACMTALGDVLLGMSKDAKGIQILDDLGMQGWTEPATEEIDLLVALFRRYAQHANW